MLVGRPGEDYPEPARGRSERRRGATGSGSSSTPPTHGLDRLYRSALALVHPSLYEGFGFTPLEAMARGCPVLASDIPALREISGAGALLVPLDDARRVGERPRTARRRRGAARRAAGAWRRDRRAATRGTATARELLELFRVGREVAAARPARQRARRRRRRRRRGALRRAARARARATGARPCTVLRAFPGERPGRAGDRRSAPDRLARRSASAASATGVGDFSRGRAGRLERGGARGAARSRPHPQPAGDHHGRLGGRRAARDSRRAHAPRLLPAVPARRR